MDQQVKGQRTVPVLLENNPVRTYVLRDAKIKQASTKLSP